MGSLQREFAGLIFGRWWLSFCHSAHQHRMEKEIKQDFTIVWPVFYLLTAMVIVLMVLGGVTCLFQLHEWHTLAFVVGFSLLSLWFVRFCLRLSLERSKASPRRWLLADDGLVRLYDAGKREAIRWEQIQDMRWGRLAGLKVGWEEPKAGHRSQEFRDEFRKPQTGRYWCWIRVREGEARELFQRAKRDWVDMGL